MKEQDFICQSYSLDLDQGETSWVSPSNIALVKYWGKKPDQIPANPSLSFTLSESNTRTSLRYRRQKDVGAEYDFVVYLDGAEEPSFRPKIEKFLERIEKYVPFLKHYSLEIRTSNTFPHSSGIASSASGMSALALCIVTMERELAGALEEDYFWKKASFLARLGSGSACRSLHGPVVVWGANQVVTESSDLYGFPLQQEMHPAFKNYQDTILLVDKGGKKVSSTLGHDLMNGHPYAQARFVQAHENLQKLYDILQDGDLSAFINIVESEALTLHAMMLTSNPYFILMKPNTLRIIEKIFEFRESTNLHPCFTLDAGANVHLLYPENEKEPILDFIRTELQTFCQEGQFILDKLGRGASCAK